jgi:hypothetical protein
MLVGKLEEKRPLERHWTRLEGNIKMNLKDVGCWGVNWIHLARDSVQ